MDAESDKEGNDEEQHEVDRDDVHRTNDDSRSGSGDKSEEDQEEDDGMVCPDQDSDQKSKSGEEKAHQEKWATNEEADKALGSSHFEVHCNASRDRWHLSFHFVLCFVE